MKTIKLFTLLALGSFGLSANAALVSLVPESAFINEGASFGLDLAIDAADVNGDSPGSFSGIVTIAYDPGQVTFDGFDYLGSAMAQTGEPVVSIDGALERISIDFMGATDVSTIGTYSFTALAPEGAEIEFSFVPTFTAGFANTLPTNAPFVPDLEGATVSVVPLPAAAWLMLSAFGFMFGFVKRRA